MSYGLPIVTVEGGGADDTVLHSENGLITQNSISDFASAAQSIIQNPQLAQSMSESALATYREHTISRMVDRIITVYNQTLGIEEPENIHVS